MGQMHVDVRLRPWRDAMIRCLEARYTCNDFWLSLQAEPVLVLVLLALRSGRLPLRITLCGPAQPCA